MEKIERINIKNDIRKTRITKEYLQLLCQIDNILVLIAVKDTPGFFLDESVMQGLNMLGVKENLQNKHWHGYIAATCNQKTIVEKLGSQDESVEENLLLTDGKRINIVSKPLRAGNKAIINIGDTDYAVNGRGLNIVVYDMACMCVVDSVCFDTHSRHCLCTRPSWLDNTEVLRTLYVHERNCNLAHKNMECLLFHNNHRSLELRAREKIRSGRKLKVFFLVPYASKFGMHSVYVAMDKSKIFEPYIFVIHSRDLMFDDHPEYKEEVKRDYKWFLDHKYRTIFGYDDNFNSIVLEKFCPDIVFQTFPNLFLMSFYNNLHINYNYLSCEISYGMHIVEDFDYHFENRYINTAWRVFSDTRYSYIQAIRESSHNGLNCVLSGYPKLDDYKKFKKENRRKTVIVAPHWSIRTVHHMATFHLYYKKMMELLDSFKEIDFYFKPHPDLPYRIKRLQGKIKGFDMDLDGYNQYLKEWASHPNGFIIPDGDYIEFFAKSDALVTDCGSFIGEYLASGNPCIYMLNPEKKDAKNLSKWFSKLGEDILHTYYLCNSWEEVVSSFVEVIVEGNDRLKEKREEMKNKAFVNIGTAGEFIESYLEKILG